MAQIEVTLKGNVHASDVEILRGEVEYFFSPVVKTIFKKGSEQIDSGFVSLTTNIITTIAAILYIYEVVKEPKLTYNKLLEKIHDTMAVKGVTSVEIVDIANFQDKSERKFKEPCIVTVKDCKSNAYYKVFYFNEKNTYAIEVTQA